MSIVSSTVDRDVQRSTGDFIVDSEAFLNKISNILSISKNTIPFYRDFGTSIEEKLFQPYTYATAVVIAMELKANILEYYREAEVSVDIGDLDFSSRAYKMTISISHPKLPKEFVINKDYQSHV